MLPHQDQTSPRLRATLVAQLAEHFTSEEWERLQALHTRYGQGQDRFSEREMAYLCFLRWLIATGRIAS
jgi:hypothetical protein